MKKRNRKRTELSVRFWKYVNKTDTCWLWTGKSRTSFGYGLINMGGRDGKIERAHRVSWMLHNGPIPDRLFVCHHCDVPLCVNPDHLFLGTPADNTRDMMEKNRVDRVKRPRGEQHGMSKMTAIQVTDMRQRYANGVPIRTLSNDYRIAFQTVWRIVHRHSWKHL